MRTLLPGEEKTIGDQNKQKSPHSSRGGLQEDDDDCNRKPTYPNVHQGRGDVSVEMDPKAAERNRELDELAADRKHGLSGCEGSHPISREQDDEQRRRLNTTSREQGVRRGLDESSIPPPRNIERLEEESSVSQLFRINVASPHLEEHTEGGRNTLPDVDTALRVDQQRESTSLVFHEAQSLFPTIAHTHVGIMARSVTSGSEEADERTEDIVESIVVPTELQQQTPRVPSAVVSFPIDGAVEPAGTGEIMATLARSREQIASEGRQQAELEFQQQLSAAIHVEAVRERTPKERLVLWSLLVMGTLAVVLGVVLGVVFGVVVNSKDTTVTYDVCEGAEGPLSELTTKGSTVGAQMNDTAPVCDSIDANGVYGVWYFLEGESNNEYVSATTCGNDTNFDTQLSVFQGASCSELLCVYANDDYCGSQSSVFWRTTAGTRYYIFVHGKGSQEGDFQLTVKRESRFELITAEIFREFGVQLNPPEDISSAQYRAAEWLTETDSFVELPLRTPGDRRQFRERYALSVFYFSMRGTLLKDKLNFLNPQSVCTWKDEDGEGVTCDEEGIVRELSIVNWRNGISGRIAAEISGLSGLRKLHFSRHNFGPSLQVISTFPSLESLMLISCSLGESLPTAIGGLTALTSLDLSSDLSLTGSIPDEIQKLSNLQYLRLSDVYLLGGIPTEIMKLTLLTSLVLSTRGLGGRIPTEIGQLSRLRTLDVSNNELGLTRRAGVVPTEIGTLSLLEVLDLRKAYSGSFEHETERIPDVIGNLKNLRQLYLQSNEFRGFIPSSYSNLVNLEELELQDNNLTGLIPSFLANFTKLVRLRLENNAFSPGGAPDDFCIPNLYFTVDSNLGWCNCCGP